MNTSTRPTNSTSDFPVTSYRFPRAILEKLDNFAKRVGKNKGALLIDIIDDITMSDVICILEKKLDNDIAFLEEKRRELTLTDSTQ
jgi:hypothetical protein